MDDDGVADEINSILSDIGHPGKYQLFVFFWTFVLNTITQTPTLMIPFTQADMNFRCNQSDFPLNTENYSSPYDDVIPSCFSNSTVTECTEFVFEQNVFQSTISSQFNLVCSRAALIIMTNTLFNAMGIPGGIFCGWLSDRFGRKKMIIVYTTICAVFGVASAFSVDIVMYTVLRCVIAVPVTGLWDCTSAHLSEITAPQKRPHLLNGNIFSWSIAIWVATFVSYFLRDWSYLTLTLSALCAPLAIAAYWIYDESPHWLYSQGRFKEAQQVINKIVRWNSLSPDDKYTIKGPLEKDDDSMSAVKLTESDDSVRKELKKERFIDIFRDGGYCKIILICGFSWLSCNLGYYGLFLGIDELAGDIFVNNLIAGAVELIAYASAFLIMKTGRKGMYVSLQLTGGVALFGAGFVVAYLPDVTWAIVTLTMIGRLCLSAAWQVLYVWVVELFPTTIRVTMIQVTLFFGHIGSMTGPLTADLSKVVTDKSIRVEMIAPLLYGSMLVVDALLAFYLPETNNKQLPLTIEEAIMIHSKKRSRNDENVISNAPAEKGVDNKGIEENTDL